MPEGSALEPAIQRWLADPESDVEYAELVEDRWAVRMVQTVRDATTVWWRVGTYTISAEAYVLPAPPGDADGVHRLAMRRNLDSWRCHFALDSEGAVVIRGRVPANASFDELDALLGEIYQMVEMSFRPMVRLGFGGREKRR